MLQGLRVQRLILNQNLGKQTEGYPLRGVGPPLPSLRAVGSTSRKPACKPYGLEAGTESSRKPEGPTLQPGSLRAGSGPGGGNLLFVSPGSDLILTSEPIDPEPARGLSVWRAGKPLNPNLSFYQFVFHSQPIAYSFDNLKGRRFFCFLLTGGICNSD